MSVKSVLFSLLIMFFLLSTSIINGQEMNEKMLIYEFTVNVNAEEAYNAWTTNEGVQTFFAPGSDVNAELFGKYHSYFFPEAPEGQRGSENNVVLSHEPGKMFSFTWDSPPSFPTIRNHQRTVVLIRFHQLGENSTRVKFLQTGWGDGEEWDKCYEYFEKAWGTIVLARFRYRFENGPVDWENLPDFNEYAVENLSGK